jgi:hypothetical protein
VLYEVAAALLSSNSQFAKTLRPLLRWSAAILLIVAVGLSATFSQNGIQSSNAVFEITNFSTSLINLGLLFVLLLFTRALHISWKSLPAGIVLGFGILSSAEMGVTPLISAIGGKAILAMDMIRLVAFHGCTLVWLVYVFLPQRAPKFSGKGLEKSDLDVWDQELRRMVEP